MSKVNIPEWVKLQFDLRILIKYWIYDAMGRHCGAPPSGDYLKHPNWMKLGQPDNFEYMGPRIDEALSLYGKNPPWGGGHDEGKFLWSFFEYYHLTGDNRVKNFLYFMREGFLQWTKKHFYHGFWPHGEVHHHMETFQQFYCFFLDIGDDLDTDVKTIDDAAHHLGNWVKGIPEWYDWDKHAFRSWWLGTKTVEEPGPFAFDFQQHSRCIDLAQYAYRATNKEQYLTLALDWLDAWCREILDAGDEFPVVRFPIDDPNKIADVYGAESDYVKAWRFQKKIGADWESCRDTYMRQRNFYTLPQAFKYVLPYVKSRLHMDTWAKLARIAEKEDPDGAPMAAVEYRQMQGDTFYDQRLKERAIKAAEEVTNEPLPTVLIKDFRIWDYKPRYMPGVLKWGYWDEDGTLNVTKAEVRVLYDAFRHTGDELWLKKTMENAIQKLTMAVATLRDGREHGCGARAHLPGAGNQCYRVIDDCTRGKARISYYDVTRFGFSGQGRPGLPDDVAVLLDPKSDAVEMKFYNDADIDLVVKLELQSGGNIKAVKRNGEPISEYYLRYANILLPAQRETQVDIIQEGES